MKGREDKEEPTEKTQQNMGALFFIAIFKLKFSEQKVKAREENITGRGEPTEKAQQKMGSLFFYIF